MKVTRVKSDSGTYDVYVGEQLRYKIESLLPKSYSSVMIITDDLVARHYLEDVRNSIIQYDRVYTSIINHGESSKSIDTFYRLHSDAIDYGLDRKSLIIALGGGVVGDLAGFVAATYMRGIDFVQMPTTILAHDSSVGGKVAINHQKGKNLIGNFFSPAAVVYDVDTIHSLSAQEFRSGYAEIVKEALIADRHFFDELMQTGLSRLTNAEIASHINKGIAIKAEVVESDEKEAGIRKHLNFGHTFGHALEALQGYSGIAHGEAVAIGMLFALQVSEAVFSVQLPFDKLYSWLETNSYPLQLPEMDLQHIINTMKLDKKTEGTTIQMVLLKSIAHPVTVEVSDADLKNHLELFKKKLSTRL
ncbi:3-dehydroquinate synthase [Virgibacillus siamensis]|uniref:3-dehydroquinate synthase n=1 Tax=Virgibacillus siamensis TaxID=480071 RepID=UPI000984D1DC|nr:3-dehydroquinate synthase [Virgibacillus siamensis]